MTRDPKGPKVALSLSHGADVPTAYVKEMKPAELYETLNDWVRWTSIHGRGKTEQAIAFKAFAKQQIGRLNRELRARNLSTDPLQQPCPSCVKDGGKHHRVSAKRRDPHLGFPVCTGHGCVLVEGEWIFECASCGERVDKLHGMWLPSLCKTCYDKALAKQRRDGNVCGICKQPRMNCCC